MSDKAQIWIGTIITCLCIFGIFYGYVYFINKFNWCLVEAVKIHTQYKVPYDQIVELCK